MHDPSRRTWSIPLVALSLAALVGLALGGCPPKDDTPEEATPTPKAEVPAQRSDLAEVASNTTLVPSPTEVQEAMMHAGVDIKFGPLVERRKMDLADKDVDSVALRTGVILADLILTLNDSEKDVLIKDLQNLQAGMKGIGGGDDIDATLEDVIENVKADALSRQELWLQVEEMREAAYGELGHEAGSRVVPLVQAGSWLEGVNLLSKAVLASEEKGDAPNLMRQPDVVNYFLLKIKGEDSGEDLSPLLTLARGTMEQIHDISMKDSLSIEDVEKINSLATEMLGQL
jgi:hypothetical protein